MNQYPILLNLIGIIAMVFIAFPNDVTGYKILYDGDLPTYSRENLMNRDTSQIPQKRFKEFKDQNIPEIIYVDEPNIKNMTAKRDSDFDIKMAELENFGRVLYGRIPVPVIFVSSKPKH